MKSKPAGNTEEKVIDDAPEVPETDTGQPFFYAITAQTPWWIVSIMLHALVIALAGLVTLVIELPETEPQVAVNCIFFPPNNEVATTTPPIDIHTAIEQTLNSTKSDPAETNPVIKVAISEEMLRIAEPSNHIESLYQTLPDTRSVSGMPEATSFHLVSSSSDSLGGGGPGGIGTIQDIIGLGGQGSDGSGGKSFGATGSGDGNQDGIGGARFGRPDGGGRKYCRIRNGGGDTKEIELNLALHWLAYHQEADGHWDAKKYSAGVKTDTAITGFALLAFLGSGNTEKVGMYKTNVLLAVEWLKSKQDASGLIWDTSDDGARHRAKGYPGAIATLALVEAAGMGNIPATRAAAQKAIDYCTEIQNGDGSERLGWRYGPKEQADMSVSGWFIMALKSAKIAGLKVDHMAFDGAIRFLDSVEHKSAEAGSGYHAASQYWYMQNEEHANSSHRLTAIGTLARQFMGWSKDDLQSTVESFVNKGGVPNYGANGEAVDLYYWYYGTLCVFQQGAHTELWKRWNVAMKKTFDDSQSKQGDDLGSWSPVGEFSNEWGRVGQTALSALCLEVYYRY